MHSLIGWWFSVKTINHLHSGSHPNLRFIFKGILSVRFAFYLALGINKLDPLVDYCSNPGKFVPVFEKIILLCFYEPCECLWQ